MSCTAYHYRATRVKAALVQWKAGLRKLYFGLLALFLSFEEKTYLTTCLLFNF